MAFDELEYVRIEGEFRTLAGGDVWDRVENVAWQRLEYERATSTTKQREFRSRDRGRRYHREYERARRKRNKGVVSRVRACKQCGTTFALSEAQLADVRKYDKAKGSSRSGRFCTRSCFGKWNRKRNAPPKPTRMVTIGKRTRSLPEWAAHYGVTVGMVYRRMRAGMSEVEALTTPKAKGKR